MNILDIILAYNSEWEQGGQKAAHEWLIAEAHVQKWSKWFIKAIEDCFDNRGNYIRFCGDIDSYEALLVKTVE